MLKYILPVLTLLTLGSCAAPDTPANPEANTASESTAGNTAASATPAEGFITKARYRAAMYCVADKLSPDAAAAMKKNVEAALSVSDEAWAITGAKNLGVKAQVENAEEEGC